MWTGCVSFIILHLDYLRSYVTPIVALWEYCYTNENKGEGYWMGNGYSVKGGGQTLAPWIQVSEVLERSRAEVQC